MLPQTASSDRAAIKSALRSALRRRRQSLDLRARRRAAKALVRQFRRSRSLVSARRVAVYFSVASEIDTAPLIADLHRRGVRLHAPRILRDGRLRFVRLLGKRRRRGAKAIPTPLPGPACAPGKLQLLLIPLLGFDAHGNRLGQGGGCYDRSLAGLRQRSRPLRIGLAYACQQTGTIPTEPHDCPLHGTLTERGLQRFPHPTPASPMSCATG